MLIHGLLLAAAAQGGAPSILAAVPDEAYSVVTCTDIDGFRQRMDRNDWVRLGGSDVGGPLMHELKAGWRDLTRTEMEDALEVATRLTKSTVLFQTKEVWGLATEPPLDRTDLTAAMRAWLPNADDVQTVTAVEVLGARVELVAWMEETTGYNPRAGHFAAFVDAPHFLGLFSGDDSESLLRVVRASLVGSGTDHRSPIVEGLTAARTQLGARGIEGFIDFTPFVAAAEEELARDVKNVFPDPTGLLGLERGTWLYLAFDVDRGSRVELAGNLHIPKDTLAAALADTFRPLPNTTPRDVPAHAWMVHALQWDVHEMYTRMRAAVVAKHGEESLKAVDSGLEVAEAMSGVDPEVAILEQLAGNFLLYLAPDPQKEGSEEVRDDLFEELHGLGLSIGVVDGDAFLDTFETLIGIGGLETHLTSAEIEGAETWLVSEPDEGIDGGLAILPRSFVVGVTRNVLTKALRALNQAEGASLLSGSRLAAAFDENGGACYVSAVELAAWKGLVAARRPKGDGATAADSAPEMNPFDSLLTSAVKRTKDGFLLRMYTR